MLSAATYNITFVTIKSEKDGVPTRSMFIIDIGGGSTEWILYRDHDHIDMGSIPVGSLTCPEVSKTIPFQKPT
jgi:exopolyphosphatase/pppGpp-phosphohydrolase